MHVVIYSEDPDVFAEFEINAAHIKKYTHSVEKSSTNARKRIAMIHQDQAGRMLLDYIRKHSGGWLPNKRLTCDTEDALFSETLRFENGSRRGDSRCRNHVCQWIESEDDKKHNVKSGRDQFDRDALPFIFEKPTLAFEYADKHLKARCPEAEPSIKEDPKLAYEYAYGVVKDRWPEAEPFIMESPKWAYQYARNVINYGARTEGRWSEAEPFIMKDPKWALEYANNIIDGRWPEAEPYVLKDFEHAYMYAREVIGGRWPELEPHIMKDPKWATKYTNNIVKDRWLEAEPHIMKDPESWSEYKHLGWESDSMCSFLQNIDGDSAKAIVNELELLLSNSEYRAKVSFPAVFRIFHKWMA